ncbi:ring-1,2-phenylacetyl-CoA epoxidase subunit PaaE [Catalinimonas alkaloidigena]|uniref:Ring-1,2-phenylacetyl-CoA epoxidase subunit PaaE n=1 Tax=Catalinimonas alkaloidigena TaxID=1075417 RepID=A0A1G8YHI7_9BACT|nr:ferredoxin--NADP reductase [Catalinimonas alkaloidigena]SDK01540.1 ring-1,2-phenylacetyl-CoA epoxidase subunit PaaE [Catalinimonas alkaloidigena]
MESLVRLKVTEILDETPDARTLRLLPESPTTLPYKAGQFLTFVFEVKGEKIRRSYSLSTAPGLDAHLAITFKKVPFGVVSHLLFEDVQVGDVLQALPPTGRFTLPAGSQPRDLVMIAAGSGITPLYSLLRTALAKEPQSRITLIYSNHNEQSTIFYESLQALARQHPDRLKIVFIFSDPADKTHGHHGHLNVFLLKKLLRTNVHFAKENAQFFLCGPFTFMRMCHMIIRVMGFREDHIHRENFVVVTEKKGIEKTLIQDKSDKTVAVTYRGKTDRVEVPYGKPILRAALDQGLTLPYSCLGGICSTCAAVCTSGRVEMSVNEVLTEKDLKEGWVLTCVGYPATPDVAVAFPE